MSVDFFPTPQWCVDRLLERVGWALSRRTLWLEPAVGDGAIIRAVDEWRAAHGVRAVEWTTMDIRPETSADVVGDFTGLGRPLLDAVRPLEMRLRTPAPRPWDVAITNPPFSQALAFVEEALCRARMTIMLLRLGFLSSADRAPFLRAHPPDVYVLPDRPSFTSEGTDPKTDYGWFIWRGQSEGRVEVLRTTPLEERRASSGGAS